MFGEIEDLANAGSFNDQVHSIGPTLFYNLGSNNEKSKGDDDETGGGGDEAKASSPAEMALSLNVGLQFGLTDATSDTALKFQGQLQF